MKSGVCVQNCPLSLLFLQREKKENHSLNLADRKDGFVHFLPCQPRGSLGKFKMRNYFKKDTPAVVSIVEASMFVSTSFY